MNIDVEAQKANLATLSKFTNNFNAKILSTLFMTTTVINFHRQGNTTCLKNTTNRHNTKETTKNLTYLHF